jgi:hypothetical protein
MANSPGQDFFISYTGVNRPGRSGSRCSWRPPTSSAAVLVDTVEPCPVHERFHDGLRLRWERAGNGQGRSTPARGGRLP